MDDYDDRLLGADEATAASMERHRSGKEKFKGGQGKTAEVVDAVTDPVGYASGELINKGVSRAIDAAMPFMASVVGGFGDIGPDDPTTPSSSGEKLRDRLNTPKDSSTQGHLLDDAPVSDGTAAMGARPEQPSWTPPESRPHHIRMEEALEARGGMKGRHIDPSYPERPKWVPPGQPGREALDDWEAMWGEPPPAPEDMRRGSPGEHFFREDTLKPYPDGPELNIPKGEATPQLPKGEWSPPSKDDAEVKRAKKAVAGSTDLVDGVVTTAGLASLAVLAPAIFLAESIRSHGNPEEQLKNMSYSMLDRSLSERDLAPETMDWLKENKNTAWSLYSDGVLDDSVVAELRAGEDPDDLLDGPPEDDGDDSMSRQIRGMK